MSNGSSSSSSLSSSSSSSSCSPPGTCAFEWDGSSWSCVQNDCCDGYTAVPPSIENPTAGVFYPGTCEAYRVAPAAAQILSRGSEITGFKLTVEVEFIKK
jgi:hypothetical protein